MISKIFAYLIIPVYTILFVRGSNWFTANFTVIGNHFSRRDAFLLWGLIIGVYCYKTFKAIITKGGNKRFENITMHLSAVLLILGVLTPYAPKIYPFQSWLHEIFSFMAAVFIMLCMVLITFRLYKTDKSAYKWYLYATIFIIIVNAVLFVTLGMVSSALEIFFTISSVILLQMLRDKVADMDK